MSRNSKNAARMHAARDRKGAAGPGPAQTTPKHGKDPARRHYSRTSREAPTTSRGSR